MKKSKKNYLVLTEGQTHPTPAKLAAALLRYQPENVVALLDSTQKGKTANELMGIGENIPIVGSIEDGIKKGANTLIIGITPSGGELPPSWEALIVKAIRNNMDVTSGMHTLLNEKTYLVAEAAKYGVRLIDLRYPAVELGVNRCRAETTKTIRIHTVGTDCNCGKKVAALEIDRYLRRHGKDSIFIATGQSGILISDNGIAMDHVISDFVSGAAEKLVLENADHDYLVIEGQGSIAHPMYSGVTLSMLHGFMPHYLVLCHQTNRKKMRGTDTALPNLDYYIKIYEQLARPVFPAKIIGIALNTMQLCDSKAKNRVSVIQRETGLPTTDVIRFGVKSLLTRILE